MNDQGSGDIRILLIRLSAIGDVIFCSGVLNALRQLYPKAHIGWLTESGNADLLRFNTDLNRLHLLPRSKWRKLRQQQKYSLFFTDFMGFSREIRNERYDLAIDLQGLLKSGIWAMLSGAGERMGLGSREGSQFLMTRYLSRKSADERIGGEYRKLIGALGGNPLDYKLYVTISDKTSEQMARQLEALGIGNRYAVISPFTTRPQKHWFNDRWAELCKAIFKRHELPVVMLGGDSDRGEAKKIRDMAGPKLIDLVGQTSLEEAAAIIANACFLVGVDTGLTHLGIARNIPVLALFGSTRPYLDTCQPTAKVLYAALPCSPCRRKPSCNQSYDCMQAHTPESVMSALESIPLNLK